MDRAAAAAFDFLSESVARSAPPQSGRPISVWIWSTLHGLAMLEADGLAGGSAGAEVSSADVVRQMVATLGAHPR